MFIERDEILLYSRYKEKLEKLEEQEFDSLLDRVDNYITVRTHKDYTKNDNPLIRQSLKTVTWRLMDYLYYFDHESEMESRFDGIQSENIGDYSYTLKSNDDVGIGITGDQELDTLLDALTVDNSSPMYFSTGQSKKRGGRCVF